MPDIPIEDRLNAVAGRIKNALLLLPKFRPSGEPGEQFDEMISEMVETLIEVSQAAAIDERSLILAQDLSKMRQDDLLASQKNRDQHDAAMTEIVGNLPFVRRLAS